MSRLNRAHQRGLLSLPSWIPSNLHWEVQVGSTAYGINTNDSDMDIVGWAMPRKDDIFPHLRGVIQGFGNEQRPFKMWQQHHVEDKESRKEYDFSIYGIVNYFQLCMENNPNMIDTLFVPRRCVLHSTPIGEMVRDRRRDFLHRGSWYKYRGYAFAQMSKIRNKNRSENPKRKDLIEKFGWDTKFGCHVVRLLLQIEEIMTTGDLHIDANSKMLRAIREGEWSLEQLDKWFEEKERSLESVYSQSKLPDEPDQEKIKRLLLDCLEQHFGSLTTVIQQDKTVDMIVRDLQEIVRRYE